MSLLKVSRQIFHIKTSIYNKCSKFHSLQKLNHFGKTPTCKPIQKRMFAWMFRKVPITELRSIDKIPKNYELIYRNDMDRFIQVTQVMLFVVSSSTLISCILKSDNFLEPMTIESVAANDVEMDFKDRQRKYLLFLSAFVLVVSVLQFYSARLPARIYYNPQNRDYIACLYGVIPNTIKKRRIKIGEMKPIKVPPFSLWGEVTYKHDSGYRFIMFDNYFRRMSDLYIMLGIQEDVRAKGYVKPDDKKNKQ